MPKFDKAQQKIAIALFIVGLIATSMLAIMDTITKAPIAAAEREALHKSLEQVLPEYANDPLADMFLFPRSETENLQVFPAKNKKGEVLAYAWEQIAPDGYSGTIRILMGVRLTGEVFAIRITNHRETPGLGDGITDDMTWLNSFVDKTLGNARWDVEKDGGDFDQFTGATITPRAVVKAVFNGLKMYQNSQTSLLKATQVKQDALDKLESEKQSAVKGTGGGKKP